MPICRKCRIHFPCSLKTEDKRIFLHHRKFCLTCSPIGLHNTRDLSQIKNREDLKCSSCNRSYDYSKQKGHSYSLCNSCVIRKRKNDRKLWAVNYLGGKCCICGYKKCVNVLDFHHLSSSKKKFTIGSNFGYSILNIKAELDKCVVLCSNCHREYHNGYIDLNFLLSQKLELNH